MTSPLDLPPGYTARPLAPADAPAVAALIAAQELHDLGRVVIEEADLVADWQRPSFDLRSRSLAVVAPTGELAGYAEVSGDGRGDAAVLPAHRGLDIGSALAGWMRQRARELGDVSIGMPVPVGSPGDRLLADLGYHVRWTSWELELPEGARVPDRPVPDGYQVREARPGEYPACWTVLEDAFLEWSRRDRETYEDWQARTVQRPGFEPWHLRVVVGPDGEVVAVALVQVAGGGEEAFIARLATLRDHRHRGLAQALLADTFATARQHGAARCTLSTDSRTGALGLYEKVGMVVTATWVNRGIDL